jgi:hypothetical protein
MLIETQNFDSVISFSQSLSQWSVLIVGATSAVLLGDSHLSPPRVPLRLIYFLFVPAWFFLLLSTWMGVKVQRNFLALKLLSKADVEGVKIELNQHLNCQLSLMQIGLFFVAVWLVAYLFWWVLEREDAANGRVTNEKSA